MKQRILFVLLLLISGSVFGQKSNFLKMPFKPPTPKQLQDEIKNHTCVKKSITSFANRLKNYPFERTTQIQFVSFKGTSKTIDNELVYIEDSLPRINDTICYSKLFEVKTLNLVQIEKLTDVFYNYGFGGRVFTMSVSGCYNPRNAILFLDSTGKVFEFIEICFECQRLEVSSEKIKLGDMCDEKTELLKKLFGIVGINYGIRNN